MNDFETLRFPDGHDFAARDGIDSIVIVGSTCAGKTTLVDAVRSSALIGGGHVVVPTRYITRPRRANDSTVENVHVTPAEFASRAGDGQIAVRWVRPMESGRRVHYGFSPVPVGTLPIYSANNAVHTNPSSVLPAGAFEHALFVGVHAPDSERERRLRVRSPDMIAECGAEAAFRLADRSRNVLPHVDVIIDNYDRLEPIAVVEIVRLVELIADRLIASSR